MKKFLLLLSIFPVLAGAQIIPYGDSQENYISSGGLQWTICYYKPIGFDTLKGSIMWGIHGSGGNAAQERGGQRALCDKRNCLSVTLTHSYQNGYFAAFDKRNGGRWLPEIFKEIYRHICQREQRDSIPVYLIGFSAGGQAVSRYMLIRQAFPDSIPIAQAVSCNPAAYTFCTDSLNGYYMPYVFGKASGNSGFLTYFYFNFDMTFLCSNHITKYYNDNYSVLVGNADTIDNSIDCWLAQGENRFDRAINFYHFSDSDAVARGTTLKWDYAEVPGVGHDYYGLYYTKANDSDTVSIAERLLFDTPPRPELILPPTAGFRLDTSACHPHLFKATACCIQSRTTYQWDFGDGTTASGPYITHTYTSEGSYEIKLIVSNSAGTDSITKTYSFTYPQPLANFIADDTLKSCFTDSVEFSSLCRCADVFYWNFGDGQTSTLENPHHLYQQPGQYTVKLSATSLFGTAFIQKTNYIYVDTLRAAFTADTTVVRLPNAVVHFQNQSFGANLFYWRFDSTFTTSTEVNPSYRYTIPGTYTVTLYAYDNDGCESILEKENYITVLLPVGIEEADLKENGVLIFPNPSSGTINIQTPYEIIEEIEILNTHGVLIEKVKPKLATSEISYSAGEMKGLFFVRVKTGEQYYQKKVMFQ